MNRKSKVICCFLLSLITTFSISLNSFAWGSSRHGSMVEAQDNTYFTKGGVNYKSLTARASKYTDDTDNTEWNMDASSVLKVGSDYIISPYHAKANLSCTTVQATMSESKMTSAEKRSVGYSLSSVKLTANFLYNLAKTGISGKGVKLEPSLYTDKVQKRIVIDLKNLIDNAFKDDFKKTDSKSETHYKKGYIILGVYLHLIQDIPAHRAAVKSSLIKNEMKKSDFSDYNGAIKTAGSNGIPMIRLKDYLIGNENSLYEDNINFLPIRYRVSQNTTADEVREVFNGKSFSFPNFTKYSLLIK